MNELKEVRVLPKYSRTIAVRRMAALKLVMQEHCKSWPHRDDCFLVRKQGRMESLEAWAAQANLAAAHRSRGEVWHSEEDALLGNLSLSQAFGQLRALAPMSEAIELLLTESGDTWRVQSRAFPIRSKIELARVKPLRLSFARIIEFYKCISASSTAPPAFVARLNAVQDSLRDRHGACHCQWGSTSGGWESYWIKVHAEEKTYWAIPCPFDVALAELDRGWGHPGAGLIGRNAVQESLRFIALSREMHAAGLIRYKKGAKMSPEGCLYMDQDIVSSCEWIQDSPLTEILDTACIWEIESAFSALSVWLDDIEQGLQPGQRDDPKYCVRLCETDEGLSLVRWIRDTKN
ncbi:hypothetical protein PQR67_36735 [Paraburkholderia fungorum]|uniref:hypothetical protein n=1 Tax=Paraburkholderia fungorum TaxID=134537 RepID=UPI0038B90378